MLVLWSILERFLFHFLKWSITVQLTSVIYWILCQYLMMWQIKLFCLAFSCSSTLTQTLELERRITVNINFPIFFKIKTGILSDTLKTKTASMLPNNGAAFLWSVTHQNQHRVHNRYNTMKFHTYTHKNIPHHWVSFVNWNSVFMLYMSHCGTSWRSCYFKGVLIGLLMCLAKGASDIFCKVFIYILFISCLLFIISITVLWNWSWM